MKKNAFLTGAFWLFVNLVYGQIPESIPVFKSDTEKVSWIQNNPQDYERLSGQNVTTDVPEFKTQAEKDAWVLSQKSNKQAAKSEFNAPESSEGVLKEVIIVPNDPTFPTYVTTGNPEVDAANYESKKNQWYAKQSDASWSDTNIDLKVDFTNESDKNAWLTLQKNKIEEDSQVTIVTLEEFNKLPVDKQTVMLSDKNYIIIK